MEPVTGESAQEARPRIEALHHPVAGPFGIAVDAQQAGCLMRRDPDIEAVQRQRQAIPHGLNKGFLLSPTAKEGILLLIPGKRAELSSLQGREETLGDLLRIRKGAQRLDINPDVSVENQRVKRQPLGVREIEAQQSPLPSRQERLSTGTVSNGQLIGGSGNISPEDYSQDSPSRNEPLPVSLKMKTGGPSLLIGRQKLRKHAKAFSGIVQRSPPNMDGVSG